MRKTMQKIAPFLWFDKGFRKTKGIGNDGGI